MEEEQISLPTETNIQVSISMENLTEKVSTFGQMVHITREALKMDSNMEEANGKN